MELAGRLRINKEYQNQIFSRDPEKGENVVGVGFKLFDKALEQAARFDCSICSHSGVEAPLLIWSVHDQLTDHAGEKQRSFYGILLDAEYKIAEVLPDWKLLLKLNSLKFNNQADAVPWQIDVSALQTESEVAIMQMLKKRRFQAEPADICIGRNSSSMTLARRICWGERGDFREICAVEVTTSSNNFCASPLG